jgi:putative adhesin
LNTVTGPVTGPPQAPGRLRMTPGRWTALAIGVPVALVLIIGNAFSLVTDIGMASYHVDRAIPLDHGRLVASTGGGDLTVSQHGQAGAGVAHLIGTVQYSLVRPDVTVNSTGITVHCRLFTGNCGLNATFGVPPGTALDLNSGGGNMRIGGIQSTVTLTSSGGNVSLADSGSAATVDSGGGNLSISRLGGILKLTTSGGDVDGSDLTSPKVRTDSGGGNVALTFTKVPANIRVTSSGGNVTIVLPRGATQYAVSVVTEGGNYTPSPSVSVNQAAASRISVDSGGGNVSITEPK